MLYNQTFQFLDDINKDFRPYHLANWIYKVLNSETCFKNIKMRKQGVDLYWSISVYFVR